MVAQLLRGHGGRRTVGHVETIYREPEQTGVIPHRPEGRCTLTQNDGGLQNCRCWFESNMLCLAYPQVVGKVFGVVLWRL